MRKFIVLTVLAIGLISCSQEDLGENLRSDQEVDLSTSKGGKSSTSSYSDFNVNVGVSDDGSLWTYTITKASAKSKDLSHFIINVNNCGAESASFANILYATVNGSPADLSPTEGSGTSCNPQEVTSNFLKVNVEGSGPWVLVIKYERGYEVVESNSWIKAGTSCNIGTTSAPGCPKVEYCSYSQGFFFANGADKNGSSDFWTNGLTIGSVTYTQAQGMEIWNLDRGQGGDQVLNGFFQLGAVRLSGVESQVQTEVDIIEAYFTAVGNIYNYKTTETPVRGPAYTYFKLPTLADGPSKQQVIDAGGKIGEYVDANHCPE